jgi:hypothetical protein
LESWGDVPLGDADVVSIRPEIGGERQGFCMRRTHLLQALRSRVVYRWIPTDPAEPEFGRADRRHCFYKHPSAAIWLDQDALNLITNRRPKFSLFRLKFVGVERIGTSFGGSNQGEIVDIYTLAVLERTTAYLSLLKTGRVPAYDRVAVERAARRRDRSLYVEQMQNKEQRAWEIAERERRADAANVRDREEKDREEKDRERAEANRLSRRRALPLTRVTRALRDAALVLANDRRVPIDPSREHALLSAARNWGRPQGLSEDEFVAVRDRYYRPPSPGNGRY